jgi:hypothetical protein
MIIRGGLSTAKRLTRVLSTRASAVLSSVGIPTSGEISGVYDGQWKGSGDLFSSICPTTGETLATVRTASPEELHEALQRTREAYIQFRSNRLLHIFAFYSHISLGRRQMYLHPVVVNSLDRLEKLLPQRHGFRAISIVFR